MGKASASAKSVFRPGATGRSARASTRGCHRGGQFRAAGHPSPRNDVTTHPGKPRAARGGHAGAATARDHDRRGGGSRPPRRSCPTCSTRSAIDLNAVREHGMVPRVFLATLPRDLPAISDSDARKLIFIKMMLPLVLHVNEMVAHDRDRILTLRRTFARAKTLPPADGQWLRAMAASYGLDEDADFDELLRRVDIVPTSLAVAQAAIESGWGTSRIAHEGNALVRPVHVQ